MTPRSGTKSPKRSPTGSTAPHDRQTSPLLNTLTDERTIHDTNIYVRLDPRPDLLCGEGLLPRTGDLSG